MNVASQIAAGIQGPIHAALQDANCMLARAQLHWQAHVDAPLRDPVEVSFADI